MTLKNNLKEIRQNKGYTQEELGKSVDVSRQTIISIERYRYKTKFRIIHENFEKVKCKKLKKLFYFN